jgi:hypothetical protein
VDARAVSGKAGIAADLISLRFADCAKRSSLESESRGPFDISRQQNISKFRIKRRDPKITLRSCCPLFQRVS